VKAGGKIAVTSWGAGRLDAFWITPANVIGHAWWDNFSFSGFQTGANTAWLANLPGTPSGDVEAVSMSFGRIDLFLQAGSDTFMIHHHSWNGVGSRSQYSATGIGVVDGIMNTQALAVSASGGNQLHLFARPTVNDAPIAENTLQIANLSGIQPNGSTISFSKLNGIAVGSPPKGPFIISDVVRRTEGGVVKHDLWGMGSTSGGNLYQATFAE
jgi:hypothetical protein